MNTHTPSQEVVTLAQLMCDIMQSSLPPDLFKWVQEGANPHDYCDANIAVYGAWCALHFAEPDLENDATAERLESALTLCEAQKYDRLKIMALRVWE